MSSCPRGGSELRWGTEDDEPYIVLMMQVNELSRSGEVQAGGLEHKDWVCSAPLLLLGAPGREQRLGRQ